MRLGHLDVLIFINNSARRETALTSIIFDRRILASLGCARTHFNNTTWGAHQISACKRSLCHPNLPGTSEYLI